jgi:hypothetical protein
MKKFFIDVLTSADEGTVYEVASHAGRLEFLATSREVTVVTVLSLLGFISL